MHRTLRVLGLIVSLAVVWNCGGSNDSGPSNPTGPTPGGGGAAAPLVIDIAGIRGAQSFTPNPASVPAGRMVIWRNTDTVVHRVRLDNLAIDTGDIPPGGTSQPANVGTAPNPYHCPLHPGMVGTLNDAQGGQQPPPCDPGELYC